MPDGTETIEEHFQVVRRDFCVEISPLCKKAGSMRVLSHILDLDLKALQVLVEKENEANKGNNQDNPENPT